MATLGNMLEAFLVKVELSEDHCWTQRRVGFREGRTGTYSSSALFTTKEEDKKCLFCLGSHSPEDCKKFTSIAERKKLLPKFGRCFSCVSTPQIEGLSLSVRMARALTTHVCVCATQNHRNPQGGSDQPSVSGPSSLIVGTESRIALQATQELIKESIQGRVRVLFHSGSHKSFVMTKAKGDYGLELVKKM